MYLVVSCVLGVFGALSLALAFLYPVMKDRCFKHHMQRTDGIVLDIRPCNDGYRNQACFFFVDEDANEQELFSEPYLPRGELKPGDVVPVAYIGWQAFGIRASRLRIADEQYGMQVKFPPPALLFLSILFFFFMVVSLLFYAADRLDF